MSEYLLTTRNLTKTFGKHKAVDGINMHIKKGSIYGFIGRNGAGKTTFMKIISGLSAPSEGEFSLFGYPYSEISKVRNRIGCLIEAPGLYPDMSAFQNLKARCIGSGVYSKKYVEELLELVGLSNTGHKRSKKFSLGMKQRLGIAMALVGEPDLLVLDEPINGLDPQGIVEVREIIQRLAKEKNMTILISSHILDELSKIATHYGIINNGKLIKEMSAEEMMSECKERIEINVDDTKHALTALDKIGITKYQVVDSHHICIMERIEESANINKHLVESGVALIESSICGEELEDYYINLTGGAVNA